MNDAQIDSDGGRICAHRVFPIALRKTGVCATQTRLAGVGVNATLCYRATARATARSEGRMPSIALFPQFAEKPCVEVLELKTMDSLEVVDVLDADVGLLPSNQPPDLVNLGTRWSVSMIVSLPG